MKYLTYDEYKAIGGTLDESAFNLKIVRASGIIANATHGRIPEPRNVDFLDYPPIFEGKTRANGTYTKNQLISNYVGSEQRWRIPLTGYVVFEIKTNTEGIASDALIVDGQSISHMYEGQQTAIYKGYVKDEIMIVSQFGATFTLVTFTFAEADVPNEAKALCRDLIDYLDNNEGKENVQSVSQSAGGVSENVSYGSSNKERAETLDNMVRDYLLGVKTANGVSLLYRGCGS